MLPSYRQVLQQAEQRLQQHSPQSNDAIHDAQHLLCAVLACSVSDLHVHQDQHITAEQQRQFYGYVARRCDGEPVAYILQRWSFWAHDLKVTEATLIPRADTECLVEAVLNILPSSAQHVLELGTGSGAIAIALAYERPHWQVLATDVDQATLAVAQHNMQACLPEVWRRRRLHVCCADWLEGIEGDSCFDAVVSNPPYLACTDIHLQQGDLCAEPQGALVAGATGMEAFTVIAHTAPRVLKPEGWLCLEHGCDQAVALQALLKDASYTDIQTLSDLNQLPRVTIAKCAKA